MQALDHARAIKANKYLDKLVRYDCGIMKVRKRLDFALTEGAITRIYIYDDIYAINELIEEKKYLTSNGMQNINAKKIIDVQNKIDAGVKKQRYELVFKDNSYLIINKTEYDYFNQIKGQSL